MRHICFDVQLCIGILMFNEFSELWYTDHPGLGTSPHLTDTSIISLGGRAPRKDSLANAPNSKKPPELPQGLEQLENLVRTS